MAIDYNKISSAGTVKTQIPQSKKTVMQSLRTGGLNVLGKVTDVLQRGNYASAAASREIVKNAKSGVYKPSLFDKTIGQTIPGYTAIKAFKEPNVRAAAIQGLKGKDKETYGNVLKEAGYGEGPKLKTKWGDISTRGAAGFALDVLADPTTYITLGTGSGAKLASKTGTTTLNKVGSQAFKELSQNVGRKAALKMSEEGVARELKPLGERTLELMSAKLGRDAAEKKMLQMLKDPEIAKKYVDVGGVKFMGQTIPLTEKITEPMSRWVKSNITGKLSRDNIIRDNPLMKRTAQKYMDIENAAINQSKDVYYNEFKGLKNRELAEISDAIENGTVERLSAKQQKAADFAMSELERIWQEENKRGLITTKRQNYVPRLTKEGVKTAGDVGYKNTIAASNRFAKPRVSDLVNDLTERNIKIILEKRKIASIRSTNRYDLLDEVARTQGVSPDKWITETVKDKKNIAYNKRVEDAMMTSGQQGSELRLPTGEPVKPTTPMFPIREGDIGAKLPTTKQIKKVIDNPEAVGYIPIRNSKQLTGKVFPPEVVRYVEKLGEKAINSEEITGILRVYDKTLDYIKGSLTTIFPAFHVRNATSNVMQNWLDIGLFQSLNPMIKRDVARIMLKGGDDATIKVSGMALKKADLVQFLKETGVMTTRGGQADVMGYVTGKNLGAKAAQTIENEARITNFLVNWNKYGDPVTAAERTKKFLFDYDNLTDFEKNVLKRAFPFYTWTAKNTALMAEQLIKNPGKLATQTKLFGRNQEDKQNLPEYQKNQYNIRTKDGRAVSGLGTPLEGFSGTIGDPIGTAIFSTTPLLKMPFEAATGRDYSRTDESGMRGKLISESNQAGSSILSISSMPKWIQDLAGYQERAKKNFKGEEVSQKTANPWVLWALRQPPVSRMFSTLSNVDNPKRTFTENLIKIASGISVDQVDAELQTYLRNKEGIKQSAQPYINRGILTEGDFGYYIPKVSMSAEEKAEATVAKNALNKMQDSLSNKSTSDKKLSNKDVRVLLLSAMYANTTGDSKKMLEDALLYTTMGLKKSPKSGKGKSKTTAKYKKTPSISIKKPSQISTTMPKVKAPKSIKKLRI